MDPGTIRPAIIEKHVASAEPVNIAFDLAIWGATWRCMVTVKDLRTLDRLVQGNYRDIPTSEDEVIIISPVFPRARLVWYSYSWTVGVILN